MPRSFARGLGATLVAGLGMLALVSCGGEPPSPAESPLRSVSGRVTAGGRPAAGVIVRLHPLNQVYDDDVPRPSGETGPDGVFRLALDDGREGAPEGQYLVTLEWPAGGGDRLGGAYAEPDGSGLTAVIDGSTTELPPFEVPAGSRPASSR